MAGEAEKIDGGRNARNPPYRVENGVTLIEIRLAEATHLFNPLDPSPAHEKDLAANADAYIAGSANEIPIAQPLKLVVHLPADHAAADAAPIAGAVHYFYANTLALEEQRLRAALREGRTSLAIAIAFLFVCMVVRQIAQSIEPAAFAHFVGEGLLIIGWVAMWRPVDTFLYAWWPIRRCCRVFRKLAAIPVEIRRAG